MLLPLLSKLQTTAQSNFYYTKLPTTFGKQKSSVLSSSLVPSIISQTQKKNPLMKQPKNMSMTLHQNPPPSPPRSMDWFSWLSGTSLEPVLVYEYGLVLEKNELTAEDVAYFDHEFLKSMGIAVAKHRLEILKLARKGKGGAAGGQSGPLSGFWTVIGRTRKSLGKYFSGIVSSEEDGSKAPTRDNVRIPRKKDKDGMDVKDVRDEITVFRRKNKLAFSGPLVDSRVQDRFLITPATTSKPKSTMWSGPLYPPPKSPVLPVPPLYSARSPKLSGLVLPPARTPIVSVPLHRMAPSPGPKVVCGDDADEEDFNAHSLWAQLFHDMKPT